MVICETEELMSRSRAMSGKEGAIMLADMMGMSCPKEKIVPMRILRLEWKLYGFLAEVGDDHVD
jgi:hypothetical protein